MKTNKLLLRVLVLTLTCWCSLFAQSQAAISLKDSVDAAMEKQKQLGASFGDRLGDHFGNSVDTFEIKPQMLSNWIDGSPTVSAAYLKSQDNTGTDELELSVNLPIKSQSRRKIEQDLKQNLLQVKTASVQQRRLVITGLLREIIWNYQLEQAQITKIEKKWRLVSALEDKFKIMSASRALPEYIALLLGKESLDNQILLLEHKHNALTLFSQFKLLTGLSELPFVMLEKTLPPDPKVLVQHPRLVALESSWKITVNQLRNTRNDAAPWQLQVVAKRLDAPGLSENQIGLGIAVPISAGSSYSSSQQSEYAKVKNEFEFSRQTVFTSLRRIFMQSIETLKFLKQKQVLLDANKTSLSKLENSINALLQANVDNKETLIRNALDVIDAQSEIEINRITINKQISLIRQAAGLTL